MVKRNFKVGEEVQFLNEVGGGTIIKCLGGDKYLLVDGDGFDEIYDAQDLINPFAEEAPAVASDEEVVVEAAVKVAVKDTVKEEETVDPTIVVAKGLESHAGIQLDDWVKPIDDTGKGHVVHISKRGVYSIVMSSGLTMEYKRAEIIKIKQQEEAQLIRSVEEAHQILKADDFMKKVRAQRTDRKSSGLWEIDLHVHMITENTDFLDSAALLKIQMDHFESKLNEARRRKVRKIVFIHGRGKGKLRDEIRKVLKRMGNCDFHDGDYTKYGQGATEVLLFGA